MTTKSPQKIVDLSPPEQAGFLDAIDAVLFDCDGVIWLGNTLIPGAAEAVSQLRAAGKRVFFVTNNATKSRRMYAERFRGFGMEVGEEEVVSSAWATAAFLAEQHLQGPVYVVGEEGLAEELQGQGIAWQGGPAHRALSLEQAVDLIGVASLSSISESSIPAALHAESNDSTSTISTIPSHSDPSSSHSNSSSSHSDSSASHSDVNNAHQPISAVVVGLDRHVSYAKLALAQYYLARDPSCRFVACNRDVTFPLKEGVKLPGAGTLVAALAACSGRAPEVVGKPEGHMLRLLQRKHALASERLLMVGDRLDTDIAFGSRSGTRTLLVLSGIATMADIPNAEAVPDYVAQSVADLLLLFHHS